MQGLVYQDLVKSINGFLDDFTNKNKNNCFLQFAHSIQLQILCAIDPSLGRVDYDSLSDQSHMEFLIEATPEDRKRAFQDANGCFLDVCE